MTQREIIELPAELRGLASYHANESAAVRAGPFIFVSALAAVEPASGELELGTVASEARRVLGNLELVLRAAGVGMADVTQVHALLYDRIEYQNLNRAYRQFFPTRPPARTVRDVRSENGFKIRFEAIAYSGGSSSMNERTVLEPQNVKLNASRNLNLPHSPAIRAGGLIFVSGMVPVDPATGELRHGSMAEEARQVLENMRHLLESSGSSLDKVVKVNVFIYDMLELENVNRVFRTFFPRNPPARTVCGVRLSHGVKVEIECVALA